MADEAKSELRRLREQIAVDFEWTAGALGHLNGRVDMVADQVAALASAVEHLRADFSETARQWQGRMRLTEQRFDRFLEVVESDVTNVRTSLEDHEERLRRLEQGGPPAA